MAESPAGFDPSQLERDVRQLLFADCRDTTTWDHLGNLDPVRRPTTKRVQISDSPPCEVIDDQLDMVVLPPALALLYEVTQDHAKGRDFALLYTLDLLAQPAPVFEAFDRLYAQAVARQQRLKAEEAERIRLAEEAEARECTFKPTISDHAKKQASKNKTDGGYYGECLEWRKQCEKKLKKKVDKEQKEKWEETMKHWEMDPRSVKIVERMKQREQNSPKAGRPSCITPRTARREGKDENVPTFFPITNHSNKLEYLLQRGRSGSNQGTSQSDGSVEENLSFHRVDRATTISCLQERLDKDAKERNERKKKREEEYKRRQKEKLYDKITGQPLFQPNAMPMVQNGQGRLVPFNELSSDEQKRYLKNWRIHDIDFVPAIAIKAAKTERRDIEEVVQGMFKHNDASARELNKKKRKAEEEAVAECTFSPTIDKRSSSMASGAQRPDIADRMTKAHLSRAGKLPAEKEDSAAKAPKLSEEEIQRIVLRQLRSAENMEKNLSKSKASVEKEDEANCTFKPAINRISSQLVEAAERRLQSESVSSAQGDDYSARQLNYSRSRQQDSARLDPGTPSGRKNSARGLGSPSSANTPITTSGSFHRRRPGTSQPAAGGSPLSGGHPSPSSLQPGEEEWFGPRVTSDYSGYATPKSGFGSLRLPPRQDAAAELAAPYPYSGSSAVESFLTGPPPLDQVEQLNGLLASWNAFSAELERDL